MGTIPTITTRVAGTVLTAAQLNEIQTWSQFVISPPQCSAYAGAAQTLTNNTVTAIALNSELFDNVQSGDTASHDNTTNNSRIVCRTSGKYEMAGAIRFVSNATGLREARIRLNGTTDLVKANGIATAASSTDCQTTVIVVALTAGDYIELTGLQTSGGNLDTVLGREVTFLRFRFISS